MNALIKIYGRVNRKLHSNICLGLSRTKQNVITTIVKTRHCFSSNLKYFDRCLENYSLYYQ